MAVTVALKTGIYDEAVTGVTQAEATNRAVKMVKSIAYWHKYRTSSGWGNSWQSALWAAYAGQAGWMLWSSLDTTYKNYITGMVEYEANRFNSYAVPYYKNINGTVIYSGDSKAEENAWNACILQLSISMMPSHPNISTWKSKCCELMVSAFSRPSDISSSTTLDGRTLSSWLNGSNINEDGTLINHSIIHDDYMASFEFDLRSYLLFSLAGITIPQSAAFNADVVYDALVDLNFSAPPYQSPGGTMYIDGSETLYYPNGTDWSRYRFDIFYCIDAFTRLLGLDNLASTGGLTWERLRATRLQNMQARHTDGHLYAAGEWNAYSGKEQLAAQQFADAYLIKWLTSQGELSSTASWNISSPGKVQVDGNDASVTYSGVYDNYTGAQWYNSTMRLINAANGYAQFTFTGTSIKWIGMKQFNLGIADVYIDGILAQSGIDTYDAGTVNGVELFSQTGLANTSHTIKVVETGNKNASSSGTRIPVDYFEYSSVTQTTVNDDNASITYNGSWTDNNSAQGRINNDEHYTNVTNNYVEFTFTGTEVVYIGTKFSNRGQADIYIDSAYQATIDLYSSSVLNQQKIYTKTGLSNGSHTIKVVCKGQKNASSTGYYIDVDAFEYK
jgi:hypothetical protein